MASENEQAAKGEKQSAALFNLTPTNHNDQLSKGSQWGNDGTSIWGVTKSCLVGHQPHSLGKNSCLILQV